MADPKVDRSDRSPPALEPLRQAAAGRPLEAGAHRRLGWALIGAGQAEEALAVYRNACGAFPDDVDLLYGLALAAKKTGAVDEADAAFHRVAELTTAMPEPGRAEILHRLATGHRNQVRTGRWGLKEEVWGGA